MYVALAKLIVVFEARMALATKEDFGLDSAVDIRVFLNQRDFLQFLYVSTKFY